MKNYHYEYTGSKVLAHAEKIKVGVAGSGNLQVVISSSKQDVMTIDVSTVVDGFEKTWDAVIARFQQDHPVTGIHIEVLDAGATPDVVSLRLRQAIEVYQNGYRTGENYIELDPRSRILSLVDVNSFEELLLDERYVSPHLPALGIQVEDDDGVVVGTAQLNGKAIVIMAQNKDFIGGAVGEIHGAKINGLLQYAIKHQVEAAVFLTDSGGVRLHEANVGEIEISEIIRTLLQARIQGVKTIGVVAGKNGAYGGMGIINGCLDTIIVNQTARIGVSGAEVIEAVQGAEIFNASDRPLVWRVYGGRARYLQGAAQAYTTIDMNDIRASIITCMDKLSSDSLLSTETLVIPFQIYFDMYSIIDLL